MLKLSAKATEQRVNIKELKIIGNSNKSKISARGKISMLNGNSKITGSLYTVELAKQIRPTVGLSDLPFLLEGTGFILIPDALYTSEKLVKGAANLEIKKQTKSAKKKIKKRLENEAKKLLKGFKF